MASTPLAIEALATIFARARYTAPTAILRSERRNDSIKLSKINTTSRLPLGARLESMRPCKALSAPPLIPESHRDRRESIDCCHFDVGLLSLCCRFAVTFFWVVYKRGNCLFSGWSSKSFPPLRTILTSQGCSQEWGTQ